MNNQKLVLVSVLIVVTSGLLAINSSIVENAEAVICQSGQFEGFFVKSAQFCNLVIPEGPPGSQGEQGPSGITQLNGTNVYKVTTDVLHNPGDLTITAIAVCDSGDFAITGRYAYAGPVGTSTLPIGNGPIAGGLDSPSIAWRTVFGFPGDGARLVVEAFCFDNPPLRP